MMTIRELTKEEIEALRRNAEETSKRMKELIRQYGKLHNATRNTRKTQETSMTKKKRLKKAEKRLNKIIKSEVSLDMPLDVLLTKKYPQQLKTLRSKRLTPEEAYKRQTRDQIIRVMGSLNLEDLDLLLVVAEAL